MTKSQKINHRLNGTKSPPYSASTVRRAFIKKIGFCLLGFFPAGFFGGGELLVKLSGGQGGLPLFGALQNRFQVLAGEGGRILSNLLRGAGGHHTAAAAAASGPRSMI